MPIFTRWHPSPELEWSRFAVVACSVDREYPPFHVVRTNVIRKVEMAWEQCRAWGYRRIGFVLPHEGPNELDLRRMGAARQCGAELPAAERVAPWLGRFDQLAELGDWLDRERPEVVIAGQPAVLAHLERWEQRRCLRIPRCCLVPAKGVPHATSNPERIGYTAMSVLHQQLMENAFGPPEHPFTVVVEPAWVAGTLRVGLELQPIAWIQD